MPCSLGKNGHGDGGDAEGGKAEWEVVGDVFEIGEGEDGKVVGREFAGPGVEDLD